MFVAQRVKTTKKMQFVQSILQFNHYPKKLDQNQDKKKKRKLNNGQISLVQSPISNGPAVETQPKLEKNDS